MALPQRLKTLGENAFYRCGKLAEVAFPEGLESIGPFAFCGTSIGSVEFPASLRVLAQGAFAECGRLGTVRFGEGMEVLGTDVYTEDGSRFSGVFEGSAV